MVKGTIITCPYCGTKFPHSGVRELQVCPKCGAKLLGVEDPPPIEAPGVKYARLMHQDRGLAVLTCVYNDGVISSCSGKIKDKKFEAEECYSSEPGQEGAFFPWVAHLASVGFKEKHIEVEPVK